MTTECNVCGCKFLFQESDIVDVRNRINAYESEYSYSYVTCPECNSELKVNR